jgi:hypothetical protein
MFNSADAGKAVLVNYTHTISSAGQKFTVANQLLGTTPTCQAVFYTTFQGQAISLKLNNCTSNKLRATEQRWSGPSHRHAGI